jgi:hypothetical protein
MINGDSFHPSRGRPPSLDSDGLLEVKDEIRKHKADNNPPDEGVMTDIIYQSVLHTSERLLVCAHTRYK